MKYWRSLSLIAAIAATAMVATPVAAISDDSPPPAVEEEGRYVVVMDGDPLVTEFGVDGLDGAAVDAAAAELLDAQDDALSEAGVSPDAATHRYVTSLNGFAVSLRPSQVDRVKSVDGVFMVLADTLKQVQTDSSLEFLGIQSRSGRRTVGADGEGVVVGVIDTGIWPENPSFADDGSFADPGLELSEEDHSACDFGNTDHHEADVAFTCNNKLIGARQMLETYRSVVGAEDHEFDSARDDNGHGSHTAGTAAGNAGVQATLLGSPRGTISGVAPRAHVIAYKALGELGGFTSDLAAAIDQAVADGVDVINYSVGGGAGAPTADELAFLFAADAGVHVATSNGNSGPSSETVGNPATMPWVTSVGASTQHRFFQATAHLVGGPRVSGASITDGVGRSGLVDAEDVGGDLCMPGTLDPALVEGKVVLCRRGSIARAAKSQAVAIAGGVGMILYNNDDVGDLITDPHHVPSVHTDVTEGLKVKDYIDMRERNRQTPYARIVGGQVSTMREAPTMAKFSSRGPNPVAADIIKPDVTAPGVQVMAAYSPYTDPGAVQGENFASIAGTSMSSPHVAGLMALVAEVHPDWSPAAVRSAMMTTASQNVEDNDRRTRASVFDMGAGHVDPGRTREAGSMFMPGLVYDVGLLEYFGFLCDAFPDVFADPAATCGGLEANGISTDAANLNYPSIAVSELASTTTITRTVTAVFDGAPRTFFPKIDAPDGFRIDVQPKKIRLSPGESASYQLVITNLGLPVGEWREGSITWTNRNFKVRSPIALRGVSYAAPSTVAGEGVDGDVSFPIAFGFNGSYTAAAHGLEPARVDTGNVLQDPDQSFDPSDVEAGGAVLHEVDGTGAVLLRIALPPEATEADADLDVYVVNPAGVTVAQSTAGGTDELVDIWNPMDGVYQVYVHGWSAPGGDSDYSLYAWTISATPGGNLEVTSAPTEANSDSGTVAAAWTGAAAGEWHLGGISHSSDDGVLGVTLVEVDNREG